MLHVYSTQKGTAEFNHLLTTLKEMVVLLNKKCGCEN